MIALHVLHIYKLRQTKFLFFMQKYLFYGIVLMLLLCVCSTSYAQSTTSIGPRIGLNVADFTGDNASSQGTRNGLMIGGFFTYSISEDFGITGELLYSQQGSKDRNALGNFTRELSYLQIPLYGNYFFKVSQDFRLKLMAGPYINILLDAENDFENGTSVEVTDSYNTIDYGLLLGGGFHYYLGSEVWLNLDARYNLGLSNILQDDALDVKNSVISIALGVSFGIN
jgi:hypothetical protein